MFKWLKKLFKKEQKVETPFVPTKPKEELTFLSTPAMLFFESHPNGTLYVISRTGQVIYPLTKEALFRLQREYNRDDVDEDLSLIMSFLIAEPMGYVNEKKADLFCFLDKRHSEAFHKAFENYLGNAKWDSSIFWKVLGVTLNDVRHARLTTQPKTVRFYDKPLTEWFRKSKTVKEKDNDVLVITPDANQGVRTIKGKGYQIEINTRFVRIYVQQIDVKNARKLLKEAKRLRRQLPHHHFLASPVSGMGALPKELEGLKDL